MIRRSIRWWWGVYVVLALCLLAAPACAWSGDDDDDTCNVGDFVSQCRKLIPECPACPGLECRPTLVCDPAKICPLPPVVPDDCAVLERLCGRSYRSKIVVDPSGAPWLKCHANGCRASVTPR